MTPPGSGWRDLPPFTPPFLWRGAARQTVAGALLPVRVAIPPTSRVEIEVEPGERLLLLHTPAAGRPRGRMLLLHGLGGTADSRYLRRMLPGLHQSGWDVLRLNARGAGDGHHLSRRLAHAGRWPDIGRVLEAAPWSAAAAGTPVVAAGFSLGGAILLNYLGEAGAAAAVHAAVAVNPPTDLELCLRQLERPANLAYHLYYVLLLRRGLLQRARRHAGLQNAVPGPRHRSVRSLDEDFIAADAGYPSAASYYAGCSPSRVLPGIQAPTLVLSSEDDPFIPASMLQRDLSGCQAARLALVPRGGHVGYLHRRHGVLRFWVEDALLQAAASLLRTTRPQVC